MNGIEIGACGNRRSLVPSALEALGAVAFAPSVVASGDNPVHLLETILTDVGGPELSGFRVEGEAPGIPETERIDLAPPFLKAGEGFLNYELAGNPESRFAKKHVEFGKTRLMTLPECVKVMMPPDWTKYSTATIDKLSLNNTRDRAAMAAFPDASLKAALDRTAPGWREVPVLGGLHD